MAVNGARKAPPPASTPKSGLVGTGAIKAALGPKEKKPPQLKSKKASQKPSIPGNWKESDATSKNSNTPNRPATPMVNSLEEKNHTPFPTGHPLNDKVDIVQCKHCRRPVHRSVSANHIRDCLNKKQEKLKKKKEAKEAKDAALRRERGEKDDDEGGKRNPAHKGALIDGDGAKKGKKRKMDGDAEKAPNAKKKKKDEPKAKSSKPKGPVDVEKQCGVPLPNGGFCARSLTCKSHSMGLKRAVPGRSLPYDMLLANYQKKSQAKQQRAAIDANAPLPEDLEPAGAVDSEEEKDSIMAALGRHRPRPLATFTPVSQREKYQYIRMKDMLRSALGAPAHGGSIFGSTNNENFPGNTNSMSGYAPPSNTGALDGSANGGGGGINPGSRQQSSISMAGPSNNAGPRQILPGQLPGPVPQQRQGSISSVASMGGA